MLRHMNFFFVQHNLCIFLQVFELLEMLIVHLEGHCMDQLYLLLFEPLSAELLYCLLADNKFTMELKQKILKVSNSQHHFTKFSKSFGKFAYLLRLKHVITSKAQKKIS